MNVALHVQKMNLLQSKNGVSLIFKNGAAVFLRRVIFGNSNDRVGFVEAKGDLILYVLRLKRANYFLAVEVYFVYKFSHAGIEIHDASRCFLVSIENRQDDAKKYDKKQEHEKGHKEKRLRQSHTAFSDPS